MYQLRLLSQMYRYDHVGIDKTQPMVPIYLVIKKLVRVLMSACYFFSVSPR